MNYSDFASNNSNQQDFYYQQYGDYPVAQQAYDYQQDSYSYFEKPPAPTIFPSDISWDGHLPVVSDHPQSFFSAWCEVIEQGNIKSTPRINFCSWNILSKCKEINAKDGPKKKLKIFNNPWNCIESDEQYEKRFQVICDKIIELISNSELDIICLQEAPIFHEVFKKSSDGIKKIAKKFFEKIKKENWKRERLKNKEYSELFTLYNANRLVSFNKCVKEKNSDFRLNKSKFQQLESSLCFEVANCHFFSGKGRGRQISQRNCNYLSKYLAETKALRFVIGDFNIVGHKSLPFLIGSKKDKTYNLSQRTDYLAAKASPNLRVQCEELPHFVFNKTHEIKFIKKKADNLSEGISDFGGVCMRTEQRPSACQPLQRVPEQVRTAIRGHIEKQLISGSTNLFFIEIIRKDSEYIYIECVLDFKQFSHYNGFKNEDFDEDGIVKLTLQDTPNASDLFKKINSEKIPFSYNKNKDETSYHIFYLKSDGFNKICQNFKVPQDQIDALRLPITEWMQESKIDAEDPIQSLSRNIEDNTQRPPVPRLSLLDYIEEAGLRERLKLNPSEAIPQTLAGWLDFHANRNSNIPACSDGQRFFTYGELNARVNQLARYLRDNYSFNHNTVIPILGSNTIDTFICMLALLKAGAAFTVIEPDQPITQIVNKTQECKAPFILSSQEIETPIKRELQFCSIIDIQAKKQEISAVSDENFHLEEEIDDRGLAYLLFTSGSTAKEKGVEQTRMGLLGQMLNYGNKLGIRPNDRQLQISAISHDQALCNIFGAFFTGAALYFCDLHNLDFKQLRDFIKNHPITVYNSIPSIFSKLAEDEDSSWIKGLRLIGLGGEEVTKDHLSAYLRIAEAEPECKLRVLDGATDQ